MKFHDLIVCAIEFEPLDGTIAQRILQKILDILDAKIPKELPPPKNSAS